MTDSFETVSVRGVEPADVSRPECSKWESGGSVPDDCEVSGCDRPVQCWVMFTDPNESVYYCKEHAEKHYEKNERAYYMNQL